MWQLLLPRLVCEIGGWRAEEVLEVGVEEVDLAADLDGFEDALTGPGVDGVGWDLEDTGDVVGAVDGLAAVGLGEFFADQLADMFPEFLGVV